MTQFLHRYMDPVTVSNYPGYRVKAEFAHLLPRINARPSTYSLTPYCLPNYNLMFRKAMAELDQMNAQDYFGSHNSTLY